MQFSHSEKHNKNLILKETFEFALQIVKYCEELEKLKKYVLAKQILRSGTSIGANVKEAQNAESKADFIHKLKIASKEADEVEYWLFLCQELNSYPDCENLLLKLKSIIKILNKIIGTSRRNSIKN